MNAERTDLGLIEQFLNTLDLRSFTRHGASHVTTDRLSSPGALSAWLAEHDLSSGGTLDTGALDTALALRSALRDALSEDLDEASHEDPTGENADRITLALAAFPVRLTTHPTGGLRLSAASGVPGLDALIETVATAAATGSWRRVKLCASQDCRWAFYDTSRSGGGRWCSMEVCGNRHKTRAYRQRRDPGAA
ncbi:CGNR zinc finger domain-containing protein [Kineosporia sp. J2-2]|uniref:CGNR zinc finger domain-containing protein n=1 Tax=Kineosporia corallincola TaxID=2835133 RepID=A0ABS5TGC9_9ACTN|nr:CGNR zinc finger domain-containing protein [Kineosporia corallincola]MBT0769913.1 CGNR zinc finger domain-containing protein [Kineosporia corallincola]